MHCPKFKYVTYLYVTRVRDRLALNHFDGDFDWENYHTNKCSWIQYLSHIWLWTEFHQNDKINECIFTYTRFFTNKKRKKLHYNLYVFYEILKQLSSFWSESFCQHWARTRTIDNINILTFNQRKKPCNHSWDKYYVTL